MIIATFKGRNLARYAWTPLLLAAVAMLFACGGSEPEPAPAPAEPAAEAPAETPGPEAPAEDPAAEPASTEAPEAAAETPAAEPAAEAPAEETTAAPAGDFTGVQGVATLDGERPARKVVQMSADPGCDALHAGKKVGSENALVTSEGRIMNVFVYVKNGEALGDVPVPSTAVKLDQKGCMYEPHVIGVRAEQPIDIVNSDPLAHNVHGLSKENREFNFGQPTPGTRQHVLRRPEMAVTVKCDIHPWMGAYLFVMAHPYFAVTDNQGRYSIPGLPAGTHTLVAWHETFGEKEQQVTVADGAGATADFTFTN